MKKTSKIMSIVLLIAMSLSLGVGAALADVPTAKTTDDLVVYTNAAEGYLDLVIPAFEEKYGIRVDVISGSAGELVNRLESEKDSPIGDVMLGSGRSIFDDCKYLLEPYVPSCMDMLIETAQDPTGYFVGYCVDSQVFLVNRDVVGDVEITGYADLLKPELYGKIAVGNAAKSNSAYTHLAQILDGYAILNGTRHEDENGWKYVEDLLKNSVLLESSGTIHRSVADGEYGVALTWEDPAATYIKEGATNLDIVYPKECVYFNASSVMMLHDAPNPDNAKLFIEFVLSEEVQSMVAQNTTTRPTRIDAKVGDYFTSYEEIEKMVGRTYIRDEDWEAEHKAELFEHFTDVMTSVIS